MIRATYAPIGDPDSMNSAEGGLAIGESVAWPETSQSFSQRNTGRVLKGSGTIVRGASYKQFGRGRINIGGT